MSLFHEEIRKLYLAVKVEIEIRYKRLESAELFFLLMILPLAVFLAA